MKFIPLLIALFLGFTASAQNCKVETKNDEATQTNYSTTQDEVVVSVAGRRWLYSFRKDDGMYSMVLRYAQTDMPFIVKDGATLTLTTTKGSALSFKIPRGEHGFLKNNKGVKSWSVNLPIPLNGMQLSELQNNDIASMQLELEKGQANTKVHESKKGLVRDLAKCIAK